MARLRNKATGVVVNVDKDRLDGYEPADSSKASADAKPAAKKAARK